MSVSRPWTANVGVVLCTLGGASYLFLTLLKIALLVNILQSEEYIDPFFVSGFVFGVSFAIFDSIIILVGAFFIYRRKYKVGGALSLVAMVLYLLFCYFMGMIDIFNILDYTLILLLGFGGILGLISKENISSAILNAARLYGRLKISDITTKLGKTEAEVEFTIIKMQSEGMPIIFDAGTREVIYQQAQPLPPPPPSTT